MKEYLPKVKEYTQNHKIIAILAGLILLLILISTVILITISLQNRTQTTDTNNSLKPEDKLPTEDVTIDFAPPAIVIDANNPSEEGKVDIIAYTPNNSYFQSINLIVTYDPSFFDKVNLTKTTDTLSPIINWRINPPTLSQANGTVTLQLSSPNLLALAHGKIAHLTLHPSGKFTNLRTTVTISSQTTVGLTTNSNFQVKEKSLQVIFPDVAPLEN